MLVIAVGEDSEWGRTMAMVVGESADTPLQEKLTDLAAAISKVGLAVAVLAFVVLMIRWAPNNLAAMTAAAAVASCLTKRAVREEIVLTTTANATAPTDGL